MTGCGPVTSVSPRSAMRLVCSLARHRGSQFRRTVIGDGGYPCNSLTRNRDAIRRRLERCPYRQREQRLAALPASRRSPFATTDRTRRDAPARIQIEQRMLPARGHLGAVPPPVEICCPDAGPREWLARRFRIVRSRSLIDHPNDRRREPPVPFVGRQFVTGRSASSPPVMRQGPRSLAVLEVLDRKRIHLHRRPESHTFLLVGELRRQDALRATSRLELGASGRSIDFAHAASPERGHD
jgi:hypothetical protein